MDMGIMIKTTVNGAPDIHRFLRSMMGNGEISDDPVTGDIGEQMLSKILRKSFKEGVGVPVESQSQDHCWVLI